MHQPEQMIVDGLQARIRARETRARSRCRGASTAVRRPFRSGSATCPYSWNAETQSLEQQDLARRIGERWSSPRNTCVTFIRASSSALQKKNAALPSARRTMKSPMSSLAKRCGPRTKSWNSTLLPGGIRNRRLGLRPLCALRIPLDGRKLPAGARIPRRPPGSELCSARHLEFEWRAVARIHQARRCQTREVFRIDSIALCLAIRLVGSADIRTRIPAQTQPVKVIDQLEPGTSLRSARDLCPRCAAGTVPRAVAPAGS